MQLYARRVPLGVTMPVGFVGHGNPMNVAIPERSRPWQRWSRSLPRPTAILVVSAHWEERPVTIGRTGDHHQILYDFYGFPAWMYELQYQAPGAPWLADRVEELLVPQTSVRRSDRPLDHGAWVPLKHLYPEADVPVLQISMPADLTEGALYELGGELRPLREEGVFILGTGNVVHNLRQMTWEDTPPPEYAAAFDGWVAQSLSRRDDQALQDWRERAPDPLLSHPSAEHYRPLVVAAGAARGDEARFPVTGFEHGPISRRSITFD